MIVEPAAANMGVIPPLPGFLEKLRELTKRHNSILIFDEVITGFRIAPGGAAEYYDIKPDEASGEVVVTLVSDKANKRSFATVPEVVKPPNIGTKFDQVIEIIE